MYLSNKAIKNIICWIVALLLPIAFIIPMYYFTSFGLSNEFLTVALTYLGFVGLYFICRWGTFDVLRFSIINMVSTNRKSGQKKYKDAYEYKQQLKEKRKNNRIIFLPWLICGVLFLIASIIIAFVQYN